jgi:light-independent protochlorophyllide reductase subunit B
LQMFRDDFEFRDDAAASHLDVPAPAGERPSAENNAAAGAQFAPSAGAPLWTPDGESELKKIPFFVRAKARRNTERFAQERGMATITVETLYDAKAHFSR